jgi:hypothetical protein
MAEVRELRSGCHKLELNGWVEINLTGSHENMEIGRKRYRRDCFSLNFMFFC